MTVERDGATTARRYWQLDFPAAGEVRPIAHEEAIAGVRDRVVRAVERRLVSDVPLGAFLSGGVDSTIVVGVMSQLMRDPVKTFSIGFEGDAAYDETAYARVAAERFKTDHTEFRVQPSALDLIDTLIWHHDGPFGDSSAVPTYIVSKLTRTEVTVVLTGDGGDEVFAGYDRFRAAVQSERLPRLAARAARALGSVLPAPGHERHLLARAQRFARGAALPLDERLAMWSSLFYEDLGTLLGAGFDETLASIGPLDHLGHHRERLEGRTALSRVLLANFVSYLAGDLLVKTDRCTMAHSLEARSPFLDRELVEYVAGLPDAMKLAGWRTKVALREAFSDLIPPQIAGRPKMGFGVPLGKWFRGPLGDYMRDLLLSPGARYRDVLSAAHVERMVDAHVSGRAHLGQQLWSLVCFERWLQLLPEWRRDGHAADEQQDGGGDRYDRRRVGG
jgi:asparagine synthase (glutamine-hydrolysing)